MTVEEDLKERFRYVGPWTAGLGPSRSVRWYYERPQRFEWVGRVTRPREGSTEACTADQPYTGSVSTTTAPQSLTPRTDLGSNTTTVHRHTNVSLTTVRSVVTHPQDCTL